MSDLNCEVSVEMQYLGQKYSAKFEAESQTHIGGRIARWIQKTADAAQLRERAIVLDIEAVKEVAP